MDISLLAMLHFFLFRVGGNSLCAAMCELCSCGRNTRERARVRATACMRACLCVALIKCTCCVKQAARAVVWVGLLAFKNRFLSCGAHVTVFLNCRHCHQLHGGQAPSTAVC